jgi:hypothetical protein
MRLAARQPPRAGGVSKPAKSWHIASIVPV